MSQPILKISDNAAKQIKYLLQKRDKESLGIRVNIKSGGCSGFKYVVEYADQTNPFEEIVKDKDISVFIDPKAIMYLIGSKMDFVEERFKSGFVFINPNEKESCGCGKSFNV